MSALGFRVELRKLINRESRENGSNTPDFILAEYLAQCLVAFDLAVQAREQHYGRLFHSLEKHGALPEKIVGYVNPAPDAAATAAPTGLSVETSEHHHYWRPVHGGFDYVCSCGATLPADQV